MSSKRKILLILFLVNVFYIVSYAQTTNKKCINRLIDKYGNEKKVYYKIDSFNLSEAEVESSN